MHWAVRHGLTALVAATGLAGVAGVAWSADGRGDEDRVARNVVLGDRDISGLSLNQLEGVIKGLSADLATTKVDVRAPGGGFSTDAAKIGLRLQPQPTERAAVRAGRTGSGPGRLLSWLWSFVRDRRVDPALAVDGDAVRQLVEEKDTARTPPTSPTVEFRRGAFGAVAGKPGKGIDPGDLIEALPTAARAAARGRIVVRVERGDIPARHTMAEAERLAGEAQAKVTAGVPVRAGDVAATVPLATLRKWVTTEEESGRLRLALDTEQVDPGIAQSLAAAGTKAKDAAFTVDNGEVKILPGEAGTVCCAESSANRLARALFRDAGRDPKAAIVLALEHAEPRRSVEEARALDVVEVVGAFTTRHKAGEARVNNIHRIADLVRGAVIEPGKRLSINELVGRRTADKGFVSAPVIEEGKFTEDVGGGISQFATTLFNAAFLAGLDFGEYQSHSIVISRYPYGREATLNYPHPDLVVENKGPHGVLIWPTYTGTTISVTLYSTKWVTVAQTGQSSAPKGACTRVVTQRRRTHLDGREESDSVTALYRPSEGVNC